MARRRQTSKAPAIAGVALIVASCLLLATAGDAFAASRSAVQAPTAQWHVSSAQPVERVQLMTSSNQGSAFKAAASLALLCLAATRLSKGRSSKSSSTRQAVVCFSAPAAVKPQQMDLLEVDCPVIMHVIPEHEPFLVQELLEGTPIPCESPGSTSRPALCGKCARFVAGARRSHTNSARASRARAARRAVGQRLCERAVPPAHSSTFDASKTRTKIQLGLRVSSCMRSESGRESKMSSGVEGSEMGTCLIFVAHDLKVYSQNLEDALIDAKFCPGSLAPSAARVGSV
mmetsp:Transcript_64807/g.154694  ORF Transcript_64807/g.154694 Transcript_64807/m.154694 type:complete len:288 (+) Transcript_64807:50-913(+)